MIQFEVINSGDQVESPPKTPAPIAVGMRQYPEALEAADDMFDPDAQPCLDAVKGAFDSLQRVFLGGFERQQGQAMLMLKPLIAPIGQGMGFDE